MTGATTEEHGLSHEPGGQELIDAAVTFNMGCFAYLLEKLASTPEGDTNLLQNSAIMVVSDCAQGLTHSSWDVPFIVAGRGGGALKTDLHFRSSNDRDQGANTTDVLLTLLQVFDPAATEAGAEEGYSNTPLSILKA